MRRDKRISCFFDFVVDFCFDKNLDLQSSVKIFENIRF